MNSGNSELSAVNTTCPYCGVGCGVTVQYNEQEPLDARNFKVAGDNAHPANYGKLCSKGYALADTLGSENRLISPRRGNHVVSWSDVTQRIADEFTKIIDEYGPGAIAFYVSGQLLTEDYYVVNKFVKGFLGTANIDTNSRLCMASSVAGHKRAFGSDTVPGCYEDLDLANLVVLVGSNLAWCHPVLFQRLEKARLANSDLKIIVIDPRKTATAELADMHLAVKPGGESDAVLFSGLLQFLARNDALDLAWVDENTTGFNATAARVSDWSLDKVASYTGLTVQEIEAFYWLFLNTEKVVTVYSQGVNQSHKGTDTVNSITNVHLATGRIGQEGCGPFSITGQPNAMGGREVGGLANMLACHMDIENSSHRDLVQRYWGSPAIANRPGLKAVDLFKAVSSGEIKALWVMATNPADSMPLANDVAQAIENCPFVVVSDVVQQTDTSRLATIQLPALAWSEKSGTVSNSERRISRQRSFRDGPDRARPDWWAVCQVAYKMGFGDDFNYDGPDEIFREYAGLSCFENKGTRDFDIGQYANIDKAQYDDLTPFQWPQAKDSGADSARMFSDGKFFTPNRKARFIPIKLVDNISKRIVTSKVDNDVNYVLNTGRIRDQWHTMTRTGGSVTLSKHMGEPFVEISPRDASELEIDDASLVDVRSGNGAVTVRALVTTRTQPGSVFIPMHWTNQFASNARVNTLVSDLTDPVSGQPALKNQHVRVRASQMDCYGFLITRVKPDQLYIFDYWALAPIEQGWKVELASRESAQSMGESIMNQAFQLLPEASLVSFNDPDSQTYRYSWFEDGELIQALYLSEKPVSVARSIVESLFSHQFNNHADRLAALSGVGFADSPDTGAIVCSCMSVGAKTIRHAIASGCQSIDEVGTCCGAGTQCGSCRSEIKTMLAEVGSTVVAGESVSNVVRELLPEIRVNA